MIADYQDLKYKKRGKIILYIQLKTSKNSALSALITDYKTEVGKDCINLFRMLFD